MGSTMPKGHHIVPRNRIKHFTGLPILWRCKKEKYRNFVADGTQIRHVFGTRVVSTGKLYNIKSASWNSLIFLLYSKHRMDVLHR